jgi:hypothetical protein
MNMSAKSKDGRKAARGTAVAALAGHGLRSAVRNGDRSGPGVHRRSSGNGAGGAVRGALRSGGSPRAACGFERAAEESDNQSCRASIRCHSIHFQIRVPCKISWPSRDALALSGSFEATYHCAAVSWSSASDRTAASEIAIVTSSSRLNSTISDAGRR